MKRALLPLLFALLPFCAQAETLYRIRPLSERELTRTYASLLRDACRHADSVWQESATDPQAGYWGTGRSDQMNEGIRAISGMVLASGALLKYSDALDPSERQEFLRKTTRALRYAVSTHRTGGQNCTDGKPWGGSWQSAMWTGTLAFGAGLLWNELDSESRRAIERVVAFEADRFLSAKPPGGRWTDTKAEENGWNMICLAVADSMFPAHPHAAAWHEQALAYMMNTLSVPQDAQDSTLVDGRPVSQWFTAANLHPDFTLENHGFFHPCYVACSSYFLTQAALYYTYAGQPVPQAATHHLLDTWKMLQRIIPPSAESAFPQGMDWELHGLSFINLYASLACCQKDPLAARLENNCLQYMRAWQARCKGDLAVPGSRLGFTRHAICCEQAAYAFLAHEVFGPAAKPLAARKAAAQLRGAWAHEFVDCVAHRTDDKFVSFSWKNRLMGLLVPIGPGHAGNPFFTVPLAGGFIGSFELAPKIDLPAKPLEHVWRETPAGVETSGSLLLNGGALRQVLRLSSIGEKTVLYQDRVTALADVTISRELGVPLAIENDEITGGRRVICSRDGKATADWKQPLPPVAISGSWANVDGRLGAVVVSGSGLAYKQGTGYDPHTAVCPDILYGSFSDRARSFKAGEQVARRIVLLFVEATPKQTAVLARSFQVEETPQTRLLRFKLPEGGQAEVPLL